MDMRPAFKAAPNTKVMINIGALLDVPTGTYIKGLYGESILNGGLGFITGVVGIGNNFKSTIMHYMMLCAMSRIACSYSTSLNTYDTEVNIHEWQLKKFTMRFDGFKEMDILQDGMWNITDKTIYFANEWYEIFKKFLKDKKADAEKNSKRSPFPDRSGKANLMIATPTFSEIDSFSEFETEDVSKMQDANELGEAGGNTIHMRQGLAKVRFLMELPSLSGGAYNYTAMTAHVGKEIQMATGPMAPPPPKKLQYLKHNDKLKGVTDKFTFLLTNCWHAYDAKPLINQGSKSSEYPKHPGDDQRLDTDLNIVTLRQLRSKSGPTGITIELMISQSEGVLAELTEFHFIKENSRYGISGTLQHYALDLCPEVKMQRTTVRTKIDTEPTLRRALNITAEMLQISLLWRNLDQNFVCAPKVLYDDLIALGYDWSILLATRGWWTLDNDKHPIPFLSTMDLLNMRSGTYHPYWYPVAKDKLISKK